MTPPATGCARSSTSRIRRWSRARSGSGRARSSASSIRSGSRRCTASSRTPVALMEAALGRARAARARRRRGGRPRRRTSNITRRRRQAHDRWLLEDLEALGGDPTRAAAPHSVGARREVRRRPVLLAAPPPSGRPARPHGRDRGLPAAGRLRRAAARTAPAIRPRRFARSGATSGSTSAIAASCTRRSTALPLPTGARDGDRDQRVSTRCRRRSTSSTRSSRR